MPRHTNAYAPPTIILLAFTLLYIAIPTQAQQPAYDATWESLDTRPTPEWYRDAKFGIFIHWGLYSVPAWSRRGTYAEWYWHALDGKNQKSEKRLMRHKAVNASFGMPWNSVDSGPERDLVRELTDAVRDEGLKMGLYYSLWDWFNPYWTEDQQMAKDYGAGLKKYVHEVMYPQFKQIVTDYQPALTFADGDWWMDDDKWETLYTLVPGWPSKGVLTIKDVRTSLRTQITLLGCEKEIVWKQMGENVEIDLTNIDLNDLPCDHIRTFKISECQAAK